MGTKKEGPVDDRLTLRFASAKLKQQMKRRARQEGRTLTGHINEICKEDAAKGANKK